MAEVFFNDTWRAYAHDPNDPNWTRSSYKSLGIVSCVSDFWTLWNSCRAVVDRTMIFIMREHVFPSWDDDACIDGCIASAIVPVDESTDVFEDLVKRALGERLASDPLRWDCVNGVSIAPKNGICVVKVWLSAVQESACGLKLPAKMVPRTMRFQACRQHIEVAGVKVTHR